MLCPHIMEPARTIFEPAVAPFRSCIVKQDPDRVREITYGMIRKVARTPVTVKCRIGVDDRDS